MTKTQLALITLITLALKAKGYRYLADVDDEGALRIRIWKGLDKS